MTSSGLDQKSNDTRNMSTHAMNAEISKLNIQ